ncbi:PIGR protein, partial [Turnix velox]|nr:PIGR protein [Turnix velox]
MALLAFILLLTFLPDASSRLLPKAAISGHVFGPQQVYGLLEGSVTVKCFYPPTSVNRHDRKYWCRETPTGCTTVVSTNGYKAPGYKGRVSIIDYPLDKNFQITMTGLTKEDEGTYQCGIGINGRGLSFKVGVVVSEGSEVPEAAELFYVKLYDTFRVTCSFADEYAPCKKYICKSEKSGCSHVADNQRHYGEAYKGRALLKVEMDPSSFSVTITQMSWEDSGLYVCGANCSTDKEASKELDVYVYEEGKIPQVKPTVFGVKGSSATFECRYEPLRDSSEKFWAKWNEGKIKNIISTKEWFDDLYKGRVAIFSNPQNNTYTVILNQLTDSDSGYYWCMSDQDKEQQTSTELKVIDGEPGLEGKTPVVAQVGSRVDLTCSYPCKYYSYQKYWCKWSNTGCTILPSTDNKQPGTDVSCDTDNRTVTLTINPVGKSDHAGTYWCGVKRNGVFGETMAVKLEVPAGEIQGKGRAFPPPQHCRSGCSSAGRKVLSISTSSEESHRPNTLLLVLGPVGAALLVLVAAFAVFKFRQLRRSDLVSVGSYRTNISMSDFECVKEYGASNKGCVKETQETQMGGD